MASSSTKTSNLFNQQDNHLWNSYFEDKYLPRYYEQDIQAAQAPSFRSVSPKIYPGRNQKQDYFSEISEELEFGDDCDALYEATLMNSNFLATIEEPEKEERSIATSLGRLRQILGHINPSCQSTTPLSHVLETKPPSLRSKFSSSAFTTNSRQPQKPATMMLALSMPDPLDRKGKGKWISKSTL